VAAPAKKKFPIVPVIIGGVALMVAAGVAIFFIATTPSRKYKAGVKAYDAGDYANAAAQFEAAGNFQDAKERAEEATTMLHYTNGKDAFSAGDYAKAKEEFEACGSYKGQ
jgi:tetratricopeptide (TPR) repeat protein